MLAYKTAFVLGAGASMPYGFPSGAKLLQDVRMLPLDSLQQQAFLHPDLAQQLQQALVDSQEESLDAMLETQSAEIQNAGKRLIARGILLAEHKFVRPRSGDWFSYLFSRMSEGITGQGKVGFDDFFARNDFSFVNYNYDRLVEYSLMSGLRSKYGVGDAEWQRVKEKVIHLHGSIGEIDPTKQQHVPWGAKLAGGAELDEKIGPLSMWGAQSIRIVHEPKPEEDEFKRARAVLGQAARVFFLGFAFGRTNVDRLDFGHINRQAVIRYSRFGLTDQETDLYVRQPMGKASIEVQKGVPHDWDCLALLRENIAALVARY